MFNVKISGLLIKWINTVHILTVLYIDSKAGLTLNYQGKFNIDSKGKFNNVENREKKEVGFMKAKLQPNRVAIAEIPESKFKELNIEKIPNWLKIYKNDENSIERLYSWAYMYNGWNECEKALIYLEKAEKIDSNFKGLQTELAFSYNALGKYDKAEIALTKAIKNNPKDCYSLKELAYTYNLLNQLDKSAETYNKMVSVCAEKNFVQETAYNLAGQYFQIKDHKQFEHWNKEARKWSEKENQITKKLDQMSIQIKK